MAKEKINVDKEKPLILLAPLDWGLGHTTRCIPLIQELLNLSCHLLVACNSVQKQLLKQEFSGIDFLDLPGYDIKYGNGRVSTFFKIIWQIPKILIKIKREKKWLAETLKRYSIDCIISDNRYGIYHAQIPSVLITHQLSIRSGVNRTADAWIQKKLYRLIAQFKECWIPDTAGAENLAGELSNPVKMPPVPVRYLGNISRFIRCSADNQINGKILVVLSGPEPQRTAFEEKILRELNDVPFSATVIRGCPGSGATIHHGEHLTIFDHLPARDLNRLACESEYIISRAGYTSVMDYLKLRKKMILVATPGQTEQEYIADRLMSKKLALTVKQSDFSIHDSLKRAQCFPYEFISNNMDDYKKTLRQFIVDYRFV